MTKRQSTSRSAASKRRETQAQLDRLRELLTAKGATDWDCIKFSSPYGTFYLARDERQRQRFAVKGRAVFSRAELREAIPMLKALSPDALHDWMSTVLLLKSGMSDARIEEVGNAGRDEDEVSM